MRHYPIVHGVDQQSQAGEDTDPGNDEHDRIADGAPRRQQGKSRGNERNAREKWKKLGYNISHYFSSSFFLFTPRSATGVSWSTRPMRSSSFADSSKIARFWASRPKVENA